MSSRASESSLHVGRLIDPDVLEDGGLEPVLEEGVLPISPSNAPVSAPRSQVLPGQDSEPSSLPVVSGEVAIEAPASSDEVRASDRVSGSGHSNAFVAVPTRPTVDAPRVVPVVTPLPPAVTGVSRTGLLQSSSEAEGTIAVEQAKALGAQGARRGPAALDLEGLAGDEPSPSQSREQELDLIAGGLLSKTRRATLDHQARPVMSPNMVAFFGATTGILIVASIIAIAMRFDTSRFAIPREAPTVVPSAAPVPSSSPEAIAQVPPKARTRVPGPYRVRDSANDSALRVGEGQIGFEPFLKAVEKAGLPLKEAYRVLKAFERVRPLNSCSKHDRFAFALDRATKKVKAFEYIIGPEEIFQAKEGKDGLLAVEKLDLKVQRERVTGAFLVAEAGLERAVSGGGFEPALLRVMREAMTGHASLDELGRGARVRVIAQEVTALGEFSRYAGIEALEVNFPKDRKPLRIYYFSGSKSRGYFDETGRAPYEGGWRNPIPNAPVTSKFNMKRMHPVLHKTMPHTGTDFGAAMGTPVGASSFGTISFMGWGGPSGNLVKVQHADDIETGYAHLQRFAEGLKVGDKVSRLQTVGYCGSTGRSTGPHLHFTVKRKGEFIDPESLKLDALRVLPSDERAVFMEHKAQYDAKLDAIALPALPNTKLPDAPTVPAPEGEEDEGLTGGSENKAEAAPPAPLPQPMPTSTPGPSLYLTDEELRHQQKASDDGEVEE